MIREIEYYNLDVIISVGYRVKSKNGIIFRKWANKVLKDYMLKGYAVNEKRLESLEKVAKFLYTIVKNHSFIDENQYLKQKIPYFRNLHVMSINF